MRHKGKGRRSKLIRELDDITRQLTKMRDLWRCQKCGHRPSPQGLHWAHIVGRSDHSLRWDLLNCLALCCAHHRYFHGHPHHFVVWFGEKFPERAAYLEVMRQRPKATIHISDLQGWLENQKAELARMEARYAETNNSAVTSGDGMQPQSVPL